MKRLLASAAAAVLMTGSAAFAADIYSPPPEPAPPAEYGAGDWSGFYIGGHTGYAWGTPKDGAECEEGNLWVAVMEPGDIADLSDCFFTDEPLAAGSLTNDTTFNMGYEEVDDFKGWLAGLQVGYNMQWGNFILGAEVNGSVSNINSGRIGISEAGVFTGNYDINWIVTGTSKLGFAMGKVMIYGEGGLALLGTSVDNSFGVSDQTTALGWTAGVGGAIMMTDSLSLFAKYNYIRADNVEHQGQTFLLLPTYFLSDIELNVVQVGFNKHF